MNNKEYANILLPGITKTIEDYKTIYPVREVDEKAIITRAAPSPTGFVHMGSLFQAFISKKMAKQTNGVLFLRIEDTDQKRQVENGITGIINDFKLFDIDFDEGMTSEQTEKGNYGPYLQSQRKEIYWAFAKHLIENDLAYPCFCKEEELTENRNLQEQIKDRIGYYGKYAVCRNLTKDEVLKKTNNGEKYIIRLKSPGDFNNKFVFEDQIKGKMELPENDLDIVIIKGDGLPTYHFAHLVDDYLMRTTHVIRGDEWLSSVPIHLQLFRVFGFKPPKYAHIAPLLKEDNGNKRKLSKRKDPEAAVSFYHEQGIPYEAVSIYLATIANSNFEAWYDANSTKSIDDFEMTFKKIGTSGALFDTEKLINISKNYISKLTAEEVYNKALEYAKEYNKELEELLTKYKEYSTAIFNIERQQKKPRKDIALFNDVMNQIWYMYDEVFDKYKQDFEYQVISDKKDIKQITSLYLEKYYSNNDDKETWFNKIKDLSEELGYAREVKEYKENPDLYKGHVGDVSTVLRVALTTKSMTPDLYEIMKLMGKERIKTRYNNL